MLQPDTSVCVCLCVCMCVCVRMYHSEVVGRSPKKKSTSPRVPHSYYSHFNLIGSPLIPLCSCTCTHHTVNKLLHQTFSHSELYVSMLMISAFHHRPLNLRSVFLPSPCQKRPWLKKTPRIFKQKHTHYVCIKYEVKVNNNRLSYFI